MFGFFFSFLKAEQINLSKRSFCNAEHLKQVSCDYLRVRIKGKDTSYKNDVWNSAIKKNDIVPRSYHMNRLALEGLGTRLDNYIYFHIVQRHPSLRQYNKRKNTGFDLSFF